MKAVILNGSRQGDDATDTIHGLVADALAAKGWEVQPFILREMEIRHCVGCFGCWVQTPGVCLVNDSAREIARQFIQSDLVIFLTPLTFGGYSSELKKALDRIICLVSPLFMRIEREIHHQPRYERYPCLLGLGVLPQTDGESEEIFHTLVGRNAINMHAPAQGSAVILSSWERQRIQDKVHGLLAAMGMGE